MKHYCFICVVAILLFGCNDSTTSSTTPSQLVPEQFDIVLKVNASESLDIGIKNNNLIQELIGYEKIGEFNENLENLKQFGLNNSWIAITKTNNDSLDISLIISASNIAVDSLNQSSTEIELLATNSKDISEITLNKTTFYAKAIDSIYFISNNKSLTLNAKISETLAPEIKALSRLSNHERMVSILAKNDVVNMSHFFEESQLNNRQFANYSIFDTEISQNTILWNGITKGNDSTKFINVFKNVIPQEHKAAQVVPQSSSQYKSITFDDFDVLSTNMQNTFELNAETNCSTIFQTINEIAEVKFDNTSSIVVHSIDPIATQELFDFNLTALEYRGISIYDIDTKSLTDCVSPLFDFTDKNKAVILDSFFVFANDTSVLESYISNYQNNSVLAQTEHFKSMMSKLSDESSLFIYMNSAGLNSFINSINTDDKILNISEYKSSAIQFIYDSDYAHMNAAFTTSKNDGSGNGVIEELDIKLDNEIIISPQLVRNHRTNQMDILTQDINNNLYLISNSGKVFWKKQLDGKIMGKVNQIDTYKNGRLQLVFNTSKRLYVLDRNGKDVNAFPLSFSDEITQPVSVFDYDKKKNYRLMITQGKSVLMYDKNGKIVSGFKYRAAANNIITQPKHFRIGRKDFLVFAEGNHIEILDRVGKTRIDVRNNISFSENEIYLYQNKFTTSSTNGELIQISSNGNKTSRNLQVNSDHKFATTSKTLVVLNDNKLTIKSNSIDLDFGVYTSPKIYYINDKIYVTVTDLQSKKGYLFDSQAQPISNFPVFANSELQLGNIDNDRALEVVTKGDDNAIIIYEIN